MAQNILVDDPYIQSHAAYSLLKRKFEAEGEPLWDFRQRWRRELLQEKTRQGVLYCEYCKTGPLAIHPWDIEAGQHRKAFQATLDHVIPVYLAVNPFDLANIVVACSRCNSSKGGRLLSEWTNRPLRWDLELERRKEKKRAKRV